jgi:hypothetical protein
VENGVFIQIAEGRIIETGAIERIGAGSREERESSSRFLINQTPQQLIDFVHERVLVPVATMELDREVCPEITMGAIEIALIEVAQSFRSA